LKRCIAIGKSSFFIINEWLIINELTYQLNNPIIHPEELIRGISNEQHSLHFFSTHKGSNKYCLLRVDE
jgi:hypothetical protein